MSTSRILRSAAILSAVLVLGAAALSAGAVDAAKNARSGGGQTGGGGGSYACVVTPNPVAVNTTYTISGSGFAGKYIDVMVGGSVYVPTINADGTFAFSLWQSSGPGNYTVWVSSLSGNGKWTTLTACAFTVV